VAAALAMAPSLVLPALPAAIAAAVVLVFVLWLLKAIPDELRDAMPKAIRRR
jgi:hypothetical protein